MMNCAERLVEIFGSQADVARAFQLDRAVVHNWVKVGYVPARGAGEVDPPPPAPTRALEVTTDAGAKTPVRGKPPPGAAPSAIPPEPIPMSQSPPPKPIYSSPPPQ